MFKMSIDPSNRRVLINSQQSPLKIRTGIRKAFFYAGRNYVEISKKNILDKKTKTGRIYLVRLGNRVKRHQASSPEQYPANLTGVLRKSHDFTVVGDSKMIFGARLDAYYAKFLEEGTSKMAPRPFLKKTVTSEHEKTLNFLSIEVRKRLSGR